MYHLIILTPPQQPSISFQVGSLDRFNTNCVFFADQSVTRKENKNSSLDKKVKETLISLL